MPSHIDEKKTIGQNSRLIKFYNEKVTGKIKKPDSKMKVETADLSDQGSMTD